MIAFPATSTFLTARDQSAIHGATARLTECETFLTNDHRLVAVPEIEISFAV